MEPRSSLPGTIQAENFDNGGEGVAYHDTTSGNAGGAFRSTDVDIEAASGGGYDVGWIDAGRVAELHGQRRGRRQPTPRRSAWRRPSGGAMHLGFNTASNVWATVDDAVHRRLAELDDHRRPRHPRRGPAVDDAAVRHRRRQHRVVTVAGGSPAAPVSGGSTPPPAAPPASVGGTITLAADGNLQAAIDSAQPGDTILLAPGAVYRGSFVLPAKSGSSYITIRSAASDSLLPADGVRIGPQHASNLARVQGGFAGMPAFTTAPGAHHYRLQFLEIVSTYAANNIVELGDGRAAARPRSAACRTIWSIDRCYIHGDPTNGQKRGDRAELSARRPS